MLTRRKLLQSSVSAAAAASLADLPGLAAETDGVDLNDVQSQLNPTRVRRVVQPRSLEDIQTTVRTAAKEGVAVSVAGGRHAMGGQQFGAGCLHLDLRKFNRVLGLDTQKGLLEVEAGIEWPELLDYLSAAQKDRPGAWSVRQKQTGVDRVSLAGTLSANAHARGLRFKPIVDDVESLVLIDAQGEPRTCSRTENADLFRLAIGGYGLVGIIAQVKLRLAPRRKVERVVEVISVKDLLDKVTGKVNEGFLYGDCQYSTHVDSQDSHPGIFSCYRPVADETPLAPSKETLADADWGRLYVLARTDKQKAFEAYANYYLATQGQVFWSDTHQLAGKFDVRNLQEALVRHAGTRNTGTEMITEVYVRPENLLGFLKAAGQDIVEHKIDLTYGTIRFIEQDDVTMLAWAKERSICVLCNLHVLPTAEGKQKAADDLRRLIGRAVEFGGRYYLTYHRWAKRRQVEAAYPQFVEFLRLKKKFDPAERFQSEWYRHYREMFADKLP